MCTLFCAPKAERAQPAAKGRTNHVAKNDERMTIQQRHTSGQSAFSSPRTSCVAANRRTATETNRMSLSSERPLISLLLIVPT